jgi:hypothetical protein
MEAKLTLRERWACLWGKALSASEVTELYNSGNGLAYINW